MRRGGAHGKNEKDALKSLADSIKEYVLTDVENDAIDAIFNPAHGKYWKCNLSQFYLSLGLHLIVYF